MNYIQKIPGAKVSADLPPVYDKIVAAFGVSWDRGLIVTYGDTIHVKGGCGLTKDLVAHECVHVRQQSEYEGGPEAWWDRYLSDKEFRKQEELEAYEKQLRTIFEEVHNKRKAQPRVAQIVRSLHESYGEMMTREEALGFLKGIMNDYI